MEKYLIEKISELGQLSEIRTDWERIYQADPNSHVYISWLWFSAWADKEKSNWIVLAVKCKASDSYVAFLPLSIHSRRIIGISLLREIKFGGKPYSVYSGFLCSPDHEPGTFEAISRCVQNALKWDIFGMQWVRDSRLDSFIQYFSKSKYYLNVYEGQNSLIISLPDNYESLLKQNMGRWTRRMIRKRTKHIDINDNYRITVADKQTVNEDIEVMCKLWNDRWLREHELEWYRHFMHHFFNNKMLRLTILWDGTHPVSALACLIDPVKQTYNAYITSYDPGYSKISPGIVLFAESINNAIENKFKYYDFTVGMDSYKLSFGPEQIKTKSIAIKRRSVKNRVKFFARKLKSNFSCFKIRLT